MRGFGRKRRAAAAACAAVMWLGGLCGARAETAWVAVETYAPTCDQLGYVLYQDPETGAYRAGDETPALGHRYAPWATEDGRSSRICTVCGAEETFPAPVTQGMALLAVSGSMEGIGKKNAVPLQMHFVSDDVSFAGYSSTTLQGHSTLGLEKHNYTLRFYEDAAFVDRHKARFRSWHPEHKYILKANYWDVSQCRNLVCAKLWGDVASTRQQLDAHLVTLPNHGAVDGFPVAVWFNEAFFGLYTLNLHKDNDLYDMPKGSRTAVMIVNAQTGDESLFRAEADFADPDSDWELEFCGTDDEGWAKDSLNRLIRFVMESTDDAFRRELSGYLDVEAAIDYLLFIYAVGLHDSGAKDLVLLNYGERWIPTVYDMEEAFGLRHMSYEAHAAGDTLPSRTETGWDSGTGSLLWDRLLTCFEPEVTARWKQLRTSYLSPKYITDQAAAYVAAIPADYYEMDALCYPQRKTPGWEPLAQIEAYVYERAELLNRALGGK